MNRLGVCIPRWRFKVIVLLNRLPWTCWHALLAWALGWARLRDALAIPGCDADAQETGTCRCAKRTDMPRCLP